jgi:hypothetical protein
MVVRFGLNLNCNRNLEPKTKLRINNFQHLNCLQNYWFSLNDFILDELQHYNKQKNGA